MRFDPNKYFARVCPPENGVFYAQNGHYFNADGDEVTELGQPVTNGDGGSVIAPAEAPKAEPAKTGLELLDAKGLLALAGEVHYQHFRKAAVKLLGDKAPSLKADLIRALEAKAAEAADEAEAVAEEAKAEERFKKNKQRAHGPKVASNGVDFYAWGTGKGKYLWDDIRKGGREVFHKVFDNQRDLINFLIDEGIVAPEEAINV